MPEQKKTVLVVDDDPDAREFLTTVLEDNGIASTTAKDGVEAIESIERSVPDLVALDISMPEKSGVAVYRRLKEDAQLKQVPVLMITGVSEDFRKFISTRRQVPPPEGYMSKPIDAEEFISKVRELLVH
ncbi:MAG: response regulator [Gemmatimonadota bacterium]|nr:MAG: response regulator [Gemmatimonadota bacterium]